MTYTTEFEIEDVKPDADYRLHLKLNGKELNTVWAPPYQANLTEAIRPGKKRLTIEVTSSWFNRLVYDAKNQRKSVRHGLLDGRTVIHR